MTRAEQIEATARGVLDLFREKRLLRLYDKHRVAALDAALALPPDPVDAQPVAWYECHGCASPFTCERESRCYIRTPASEPAATARERERCAKVCEASQAGDGRAMSRSETARRCAAAIRALDNS